MRQFLTWLLAFGIIAGLEMRAFAADPCEIMAHHHEHPSDGESPIAPCDPGHDGQCPPEHHHHHSCFYPPMPMISDGEYLVGLGCLAFSRCRLGDDDEMIPEGPVLGMDKPPLV